MLYECYCSVPPCYPRTSSGIERVSLLSVYSMLISPKLQAFFAINNAITECIARAIFKDVAYDRQHSPFQILGSTERGTLTFYHFFNVVFIHCRSILNLLRWTAVRKRPLASLWVDQCTLNKVTPTLVMPENICRLHLRRCGGVLFGYHQHSSKCTWIGWYGEKQCHWR